MTSIPARAKLRSTGFWTEHEDVHRRRTMDRFRDHRPHAVVLKRIVIGSTVIDEEEITTAPAGVPQKVRAVALYEVQAGRIARAWFIS
jgi:hypothetical protein